jgi:hypothetical protein
MSSGISPRAKLARSISAWQFRDEASVFDPAGFFQSQTLARAHLKHLDLLTLSTKSDLRILHNVCGIDKARRPLRKKAERQRPLSYLRPTVNGIPLSAHEEREHRCHLSLGTQWKV